MKRDRTYVLFDPWDEYAVEFIALIERRWGLRPLCLYTDEKAAFYGRPKFPLLQSSSVKGSFLVDPAGISDAVRALQQRFDIVTAIPFLEKGVVPCAEVLRAVEGPWTPPDDLLRFRDKHGMKEHLRKVAPRVRVTSSRVVENEADLARVPFPKFVLKPNDGFANSSVGIFTQDDLDAAALEHVRAAPEVTWVAEEYVSGREFSINGQVDASGHVDVYSVVEVLRTERGNRTFYDLSHPVRSHADEFVRGAAYAREVVRGLGLKRSPFHMEARLDEKGFCFVDLGARLVGNVAIYNTQRSHGGRLDAFGVAAHDYLFGDKRPPLELNWEHYDRANYLRVFGRSPKAGLMTDIQGVREVERLPEFVGWLEKPFEGKVLEETDDLFTMPYAVDLGACRPLDEMLEVAAHVRDILRWNDAPPSKARLAALKARALAERSRLRGRWEAYRRAPDLFARYRLERLDES